MKNLKEIKLMMERLESPRLTETELNYKKSLLKEEDGEKTQDPDQLDLFTGETKEVNELVAQFEELKRLILDEIEGLDVDYLHTAMMNGQIDSTLTEYYDLVNELEYWIDSNDFEGELLREANNLLEVLEYGPVDFEITLTPEVEELLKRERPTISEGKDDSDNNEYSIGDKVTVVPGAKTGERIVVSKIGVDPKNTDYPTPGMEGTVSTFDKLKDRVYVVFSSIGKDEYAFQPNELKKEIPAISEGKDEMGRMVMDVDAYREYLIKQMKNKGLLSSEDKKEYLENHLKHQSPIGYDGKKRMADRIEAAQTLLDEL